MNNNFIWVEKIVAWGGGTFYMLIHEVNNYIVRSYRDVIVVANNVTRRSSKA